MDMFNVKRRDYPNVEKFSDMKAKPYGGPKEAMPFDPNSKKEKLEKYQRVIDRNPDMEGGNFNHNYDPTWKAITRDVVSRAANKKPFNPMYAKPTTATTKAVEEGKILRFEQFLNENFNMFSEETEDTEIPGTSDEPIMPTEPEVDEEQLEKLLEEFKDDIKDMIDEIMEKMEIEKEEASNLLVAAIKKVSMEDESEEDQDDDQDEDDSDKEEDETDEDLNFGAGSGPKEEE